MAYKTVGRIYMNNKFTANWEEKVSKKDVTLGENQKESTEKIMRILYLMYTFMRGNSISISTTAKELGVSEKSILRVLSTIKNFLCDSRSLVGNTKIIYSHKMKMHHLDSEDCLQNEELLIIIKVLLSSRLLSKDETEIIIRKLKRAMSSVNKTMMDNIIKRELQEYQEVARDNNGIMDYVGSLIRAIYEQKELTLAYRKMDKEEVVRRVQPLSMMVSEYYLYLICYRCDDEVRTPIYFRVDRILNMTVYNDHFRKDRHIAINEGLVRQKVQYMFSGKKRCIRFSYNGPSINAILDRIPTARIVETLSTETILEADIEGDGIKMVLLSQGSKVKVLAPQDFVDEMRDEIATMYESYSS